MEKLRLDHIGWTQWGQQTAHLGHIESERTGRGLMIAAIKLAFLGHRAWLKIIDAAVVAKSDLRYHF